MKSYSLSHLDDHVVMQGLVTLVSKDRSTTAMLVAHIGEVDHRKLYAGVGYESMYLYCVHGLRMSEGTAYRRLQVARAARKFPAIFAALEEGHLNLTTALLLRPHLTRGTARELIAAATHKTRRQVEQLLAERFPRPDVPTLVQAISAPARRELDARPMTASVAQSEVVRAISSNDMHLQAQLAPALVGAPSGSRPSLAVSAVPEPVDAPRGKVTPLAPGRFAYQFTFGQSAHDLMLEAQELLGHVIPSGDIAEVIERALLEMVERLRKQKFGKSAQSRPQLGTPKGRTVPAAVRRTVWQRDGGQCTFKGANGMRCESRTRLEFDHVTPVARGGETTVANLRLRCRTHNQYEAERMFGAWFMHEKRLQAREHTAFRLAQERAAQDRARDRAQEPIHDGIG